MNKWSREETIVAFNVYCKIPFKDSSKAHPLIKKYAAILGRTPDALNMKVGNIGRLDPDLKKQGITGLVHGAKMEEEIWREFQGNPEYLAYESERIIAELQGKSIEESVDIKTDDLPQGLERQAVVKQRVNHVFFRQSVMSSYDNRCCISGVGNPELLEACHIIGWAQDPVNRTNPKNGLCLNNLFHKAYDKYLLAITPDYEIIISDEMIANTQDERFRSYLIEINGNKINLPNKFLPQKEFLDIHYQKYLCR